MKSEKGVGCEAPAPSWQGSLVPVRVVPQVRAPAARAAGARRRRCRPGGPGPRAETPPRPPAPAQQPHSSAAQQGAPAPESNGGIGQSSLEMPPPCLPVAYCVAVFMHSLDPLGAVTVTAVISGRRAQAQRSRGAPFISAQIFPTHLTLQIQAFRYLVAAS